MTRCKPLQAVLLRSLCPWLFIVPGYDDTAWVVFPHAITNYQMGTVLCLYNVYLRCNRDQSILGEEKPTHRKEDVTATADNKLLSYHTLSP